MLSVLLSAFIHQSPAMEENSLAKQPSCGTVAEMLIVVVVAIGTTPLKVSKGFPTDQSGTHSWKPSSFPPHVKYLFVESSAQADKALVTFYHSPQTELLGNGSTALVQLEDLEHSAVSGLFPNLSGAIHHRQCLVVVEVA